MNRVPTWRRGVARLKWYLSFEVKLKCLFTLLPKALTAVCMHSIQLSRPWLIGIDGQESCELCASEVPVLARGSLDCQKGKEKKEKKEKDSKWKEGKG
ncbi:hypothetical protein DFH27DRAFT_542001, partial [Peziza echinospora]